MVRVFKRNMLTRMKNNYKIRLVQQNVEYVIGAVI